jgi:hypothetical protein
MIQSAAFKPWIDHIWELPRFSAKPLVGKSRRA